MECNVRENLRRIIESRGMKKKTIAQRAGYTGQQLSDILHGRKSLRAEDIAALCTAMDVTPNELFGVDGRA